jgi:ribosomal protein S18 acetylase RimI-like enzyme
MLMQIQVRKAAATDYEALCELFDQVDALHRDNLPQIFQKPNGPIREHDYYLGLIADENVGLFIAEAAEKLLGFVHVVLRDAPPIPIFVPRCVAVIDGIGVKSEAQRRGIGQTLSKTASEWAIARGATSIELNVYNFNQPAMAFYQSLGYETISCKMIKMLK